MKSIMCRRRFLQVAGLTGAGALLGGCSKPTSATGDFRGQDLRVFVYAGGHEATMRDVFVPQFEAATGATISLQPGWWDAIPKLKAAPADQPPFDLVITDATQGYPAARSGLFQQLDLGRIPNAQRLVPSVLDNWVYKDRYGIIYADNVLSLTYFSQ